MLARLRSFAVAAALAASCAGPRPQPPPVASRPASPAKPPDGAVALAEAFVSAHFARHPESATTFTWPAADHGALTDHSPAAERAWEREEDRFLAQAKALPAGAPGSPEWLSRGIVVEALEDAVAYRACRPELWAVSSTWGWHSRLGLLATLQPVGTPALRDAAVRRLEAVPRYVDVELANLREGLRLGYAATRENVERVLTELDALVATPAPESAYMAPARRDPDPAFRARLQQAVGGAALPAVGRYRDFLRDEYLPRARTEQGVSTFPTGDACYRAAVRRYTTLPLAAREVHDTGLARIEALERELAAIGRRAFATSDVPALLRTLRTDPRDAYRSSDEILSATQAAIARAEAAAPRWFGRLPQAPVRVQPYPEFQARSAPVERYAPSRDGGRLVGVYFINVFDPVHKPRANTESTAFHETVPGHHLQIALALERSDLPSASRYLFNSGFAEGWALYAERLADEMGIYGGDLDRVGMLSSASFRAARLVVDSGLHAFHWSRAQAIDYMLAHTTLAADSAASEVDRYAADPGQATAYMVGALEIARLRAASAEALGPRFDVRAFHDVVLDDGPMPLTMLRERVDAWIAARRTASAAR